MYEPIQEKISITFQNQQFLETAFIHKSYINEYRGGNIESNERMEFLGDAVLELSVTKALYETLTTESEGKLTSIRSALVRGESLAETARDLGLGEFLKFSVGEENSGGREKDYILANTFEALIGAIYLDQGYEVADDFIKRTIFVKLDEVLEKKLHIDGKTEFQECAQAEVLITPEYQLLSEEGPDHDKQFTMGAFVADIQVGEGMGSSKRKAQENAARNALENVDWDELREKLRGEE